MQAQCMHVSVPAYADGQPIEQGRPVASLRSHREKCPYWSQPTDPNTQNLWQVLWTHGYVCLIDFMFRNCVTPLAHLVKCLPANSRVLHFRPSQNSHLNINFKSKVNTDYIRQVQVLNIDNLQCVGKLHQILYICFSLTHVRYQLPE